MNHRKKGTIQVPFCYYGLAVLMLFFPYLVVFLEI